MHNPLASCKQCRGCKFGKRNSSVPRGWMSDQRYGSITGARPIEGGELWLGVPAAGVAGLAVWYRAMVMLMTTKDMVSRKSDSLQ